MLAKLVTGDSIARLTTAARPGAIEARVVKIDGPLPCDLAVDILREVASALAVAHQKQITTPAVRRRKATPSVAGTAATVAKPPEAAQAPAPPARPGHGPVFVDCTGVPDICAAARAELVIALQHSGLPIVRDARLADVSLTATASIVGEVAARACRRTCA